MKKSNFEDVIFGYRYKQLFTAASYFDVVNTSLLCK